MSQEGMQNILSPCQEEVLSENYFLDKLHLFMKNRGTPIERIPYLGFKQINLFLLYKTVQDMGGFDQVNASQQWKQVYNLLGGDPRSTSAATCTRRHYQRLILPFECHSKGLEMADLVPPYKQDQNSCVRVRKKNNQTPEKRKTAKNRMSQILFQTPLNNQKDTRDQSIQVPVPICQYFHSGHPVMQSFLQYTKYRQLQLQLPGSPHHQQHAQESRRWPMQQLCRDELLKTASDEPLNLSMKDGVSDSKRQRLSPVSPLPPEDPNKACFTYSSQGQAHADCRREAGNGGAPLTSSVTRSPRVHEIPDDDFTDDATPGFKRSIMVANTRPACSPLDSCNSSSNAVDITDAKMTETNCTRQPKGQEEEILNLQRTLKINPLINPQGQMTIEIPLELLEKLIKCKYHMEQGNNNCEDAQSSGSPTTEGKDNRDVSRTKDKHPMENDLPRQGYLVSQIEKSKSDGNINTSIIKQTRNKKREIVLEEADIAKTHHAYGATSVSKGSNSAFSEYNKNDAVKIFHRGWLEDQSPVVEHSFNKIQPASTWFKPAPCLSKNNCSRATASVLGPFSSNNETLSLRLGKQPQTIDPRMPLMKPSLLSYGEKGCVRRPIPSATWESFVS